MSLQLDAAGKQVVKKRTVSRRLSKHQAHSVRQDYRSNFLEAARQGYTRQQTVLVTDAVEALKGSQIQSAIGGGWGGSHTLRQMVL